MRTKPLLYFIAFVVMFIYGLSCKSQSTNYPEKEVIGMLKNFYSSYIVERSKMPEDFKKIDSIINKYCTSNLKDQLKNEDIDYDLLLDGQFWDKEWLNTMSINKASDDASIYNVSFYYMADSKTKQKNIRVQVVKDKTEYKINKVIE